MFRCILILLIGGFLGSCQKPEAETETKGYLRIRASDGYEQLVGDITERFSPLYPESQFHITSSSAREAIIELLKDSVDLILTDRALNEEEKAAVAEESITMTELRIAGDAIVMVVNRGNSLHALTLDDIKGVISGRITSWNYFNGSGLEGKIDLVTCGRNSGSYELIEKYLLEPGETIHSSIALPSQADVLKYVTINRNTFGLISAGVNRKPPVSIDSTAYHNLSIETPDTTGQVVNYSPHQAYIYTGQYKLNFPVYVIFCPERSRLAAGFSAFMASSHGQKVILNRGLAPATMPVRLVQTTKENY